MVFFCILSYIFILSSYNITLSSSVVVLWHSSVLHVINRKACNASGVVHSNTVHCKPGVYRPCLISINECDGSHSHISGMIPFCSNEWEFIYYLYRIQWANPESTTVQIINYNSCTVTSQWYHVLPHYMQLSN